ncbi:MAG: hypothetical protein ACRDDP_11275 [Plesiomonas sp.]
MSFKIRSNIPNRVVSVQVDMNGLFNVIGPVDTVVNLGFAKVHVSGQNIIQAPQMIGLEDVDVVTVSLNGNQVVLTLM